MFSDFCSNKIAYLKNCLTYILGNGSLTNYNTDIDYAKELNAIQNCSSADQLIQFSNAFYDQVATSRTIKLISKTPQDYFTEYQTVINNEITKTENLATEITSQYSDLPDSLNNSKSVRALSASLQLKLSKVNPQI